MAVRPPVPPDRAIDVLKARLAVARRHPAGDVRVPADALRAVLSLVEDGAWDEFDGHRRWAGPWRRTPRG